MWGAKTEVAETPTWSRWHNIRHEGGFATRRTQTSAVLSPTSLIAEPIPVKRTRIASLDTSVVDGECKEELGFDGGIKKLNCARDSGPSWLMSRATYNPVSEHVCHNIVDATSEFTA